MKPNIDFHNVAENITRKITLLEEGRSKLKDRAQGKADAIADYDKCLAVAIIKRKDEGKYPATLIEKIARGDCYKQRAAAELAEAQYKLTVTKMNAIQAELNGWQSINRHMGDISV